MALRARLSASKEAQTQWPWHKVSYLALPASAMWSGDRRMEAENFLASGYGLRLALEAKLGGRGRLGDVAKVLQPSRLKGIHVAQEYGTPFLAATQIFDLRPVPRKFLSLEKTDAAYQRFASPGQILITRSGTVGRSTLATLAISDTLISDDLLRINPIDPSAWGWTYAYLRSTAARAMMTSAKYGHVIKHLEVGHAQALPMPQPRADIVAAFQRDAEHILASRNKAVELFQNAEDAVGKHVGVPKRLPSSEAGFSVPASSFMGGRRRLEGVFHNPTVRGLHAHFVARKLRTTSLIQSGCELWLPTRFRRIPAEEGVELVGSADLFEMNPDLTKRIADIDFGDANAGRVKEGWLLLARSGQTYGINGTMVIANAFHENKVISDHVIRIAPTPHCDVRTGYLYAFFSHPDLGRPMVKSLAYGSSIPEIDVSDIANLPIPRLARSEEDAIADMAEEASRLFAEADILENKMSAKVDAMLAALLEGNWTDFVAFGER